MSFFKKKQLPAELFNHSATVLNAVNNAIKLKIIKIEEEKVYILEDLIPNDSRFTNWKKNIYLYLRLKNVIKENERIYIYGLSNELLLGSYRP